MSHKTLISGTAYEVVGGAQMIDGTKFQMGGGKTILGGTAFTVPFSKGIPLNTITPGAILYLNESGSPVPFYIAKHDYESGLNGAGRTLVVRKDCYKKGIATYQQNEYINSCFADETKTLIGTTAFYIYKTNIGAVGKDEQSAFLLSLYEFGITATNALNEGTPLPIADTLKTMTQVQWTRTVNVENPARAFYVDSTYGAGFTNVYNELGIRPAFTLPGTLALAQNADGTYTLAA